MSAAAAPPLAIVQMLSGRWVSGAVSTAARLRIADRLAAQPRTSAQLAEEIGAHAPSLYRLLRALASLGLVAQDDDERFALTPLGTYLRSDVPGSMDGLARFIGSEEHGFAWNALAYAVASGEPGFAHVYGCTLWQYLDGDPALNAVFSDAMTSLMSSYSAEIVEKLDLDGVRTVADVGGAAGTLLAALLEKHAALRGILFDRPAAIAVARRDAPPLLRERCDFVAGDFMERAPAADVIVLSRVLHDWPDADAARILANCRAALPRHGRLAVVESVIEPGDAPDFGKLLDLEMLAITPGRERTRAQFESLLARAGLCLTGIVPLSSAAIIQAVPV